MRTVLLASGCLPQQPLGDDLAWMVGADEEDVPAGAGPYLELASIAMSGGLLARAAIRAEAHKLGADVDDETDGLANARSYVEDLSPCRNRESLPMQFRDHLHVGQQFVAEHVLRPASCSRSGTAAVPYSKAGVATELGDSLRRVKTSIGLLIVRRANKCHLMRGRWSGSVIAH